MSTLLTILLIALTVSVVAKSGGITPFTAGGLAIAYGTINQLDYVTILYSTILFYFVAYLANTWAEVNDRSMTTMFNINKDGQAYPLLILKIITLMVFALAPIPKPSFYIQGLTAIVFATVMYCMASDTKASHNIIAIAIQTTMFMIAGALFNRYSIHSSYSMALIAAVAIPNLLKKKERETYNPYARDVVVPFPKLAMCFLFTYLTPGLSSNVITKSNFLPGVSQSIAGTILEAAIEGWVLHIALNTQITTKSVLGDLLSLPELEWASFTPYNSVKLVMLCLPLIATIIVIATPKLKLELPILLPCVILAIQAVINCGLIWSIVFITLGYVNSLISKDDSSGLIFMTQL